MSSRWWTAGLVGKYEWEWQLDHEPNISRSSTGLTDDPEATLETLVAGMEPGFAEELQKHGGVANLYQYQKVGRSVKRVTIRKICTGPMRCLETPMSKHKWIDCGLQYFGGGIDREVPHWEAVRQHGEVWHRVIIEVEGYYLALGVTEGKMGRRFETLEQAKAAYE